MGYELNGFYNVDCMDLMKEMPDKYFELAVDTKELKKISH